MIERNKVFELKMSALEALWLNFQPNPKFDQFGQEQGEDLKRFATFCVLAEEYKSGWHSWAEIYRHPASAGVAQFAATMPVSNSINGCNI